MYEKIERILINQYEYNLLFISHQKSWYDICKIHHEPE